MNDKQIRELALSLAKSETEDEVEQILNKANLWDDESAWKEFDENSGNWSTIGNQKRSADDALVEKIINSVDAVLMRECLKSGIEPESSDAPSSIEDAQRKYFNIFNGKLSSIDASQRNRIAENIYLVATGSETLSLDIVDLGEGQSPNSFKDTFLTLKKSNKQKVQFVQGKYGMGGTGVLPFGSPIHNFQLIISKRNQEIPNSDAKWGMTVVRRIPPTGQMRSSIFMYLAPEKNILSFFSNSLPLLPDNDSNTYSKEIEHGSFIKIYDYQLKTGHLKSDITQNLWSRLSLLMPDIALPLKVVDTRHKKSPVKTLAGLSVRLDEDKKNLLEEGFPGSGEMVIDGQKISYSIIAFKENINKKTGKKENKKANYASQEGIIFIVSGQTQGSLKKSFFKSKSVGMNYLSDSILITLDFTQTNVGWQEKLFMPNRDSLRKGQTLDEIKKELISTIKNHSGLKSLRERKRRETIENKLSDAKPLVNVLEKIIKQSPSLSSILLPGNSRLSNPYKLSGVGENNDDFIGKENPNYFKLQKIFTEESPKKCELDRKFRIQFETNAENNYFQRDNNPGKFSIKVNDNTIEEYSINLWKGLATLNIEIPKDSNIGEKIHFYTEVIDETKIDPFLNDFWIEVVKKTKVITNSKDGKRKNKPSDSDGNDRKKETGLNIPEPNLIKKDKWSEHKFDKYSALKAIHAGDEDEYDFFINMDNIYFKHELKNNNKIDAKIIENRYIFGMTLIGLSLLNYDKKNNKEYEDSEDEDNLLKVTSAIAPVLLPMIGELGSLNEALEN